MNSWSRQSGERVAREDESSRATGADSGSPFKSSSCGPLEGDPGATRARPEPSGGRAQEEARKEKGRESTRARGDGVQVRGASATRATPAARAADRGEPESHLPSGGGALGNPELRPRWPPRLIRSYPRDPRDRDPQRKRARRATATGLQSESGAKPRRTNRVRRSNKRGPTHY